MRYPYYPHPELFEPSLATLKIWLNTRKSKTLKGAGIFETDKFAQDRILFVIAISIEVAAFILTIWGGYIMSFARHSAKPLVLAIIASILFVVLDYFGVLIHHKDIEEGTTAKSKLNFAQDPILIRELKRIAYRNFTSSQLLGFFCILVSAILKISALLILLKFLGNIKQVFYLFYLIVIYVHLKHTGFWYFAWKTNRRMKSEFQDFQKNRASGLPSQYSARNPPHRIEFTSYHQSLENVTCLNDRVRIKFLSEYKENRDLIYRYEITCKGILWDEDIVSVTQGFDLNFQQDVYESCVKMQHAQLGNPVTQISSPNTHSNTTNDD